MDVAPRWFHNQVIDGMQMLVALALPGTPPAETVALTAQAWVGALWAARAWEAERDGWRINSAFQSMAVRVDRWPAPQRLLVELPIAAEPAALPAPRPSEDQRALILEKLAQMRVVLYGTVQATRAVKGGTAK